MGGKKEVVKRCFMELDRRVRNVILPSALRDGDGDGMGGWDGRVPLCFSPQDTKSTHSHQDLLPLNQNSLPTVLVLCMTITITIYTRYSLFITRL